MNDLGDAWKRIERRLEVNRASGCWEWQGALNGPIAKSGYGVVSINKKRYYVHRLVWEIFNNKEIPKGLQIDHICENKRCANPNHLEAVTPRQNSQRRPNSQSSRTHCPQGHRYAGENLRIAVDKRGYAHRNCVTCVNIRNSRRGKTTTV